MVTAVHEWYWEGQRQLGSRQICEDGPGGRTWAIEGRGPTGPAKAEKREGGERQTNGKETSRRERWVL